DAQNMWQWHAENSSAEAWKDLMASLGEALEIAGQHTVNLGVEPEVGNVVNSARQARRLLDEMQSPRLRIIMDAANLFHPDELPRQRAMLDEAFDLLGPNIVLAHAKELRPDGHAGGLPLGTGVLDWDYYLRLLDRNHFTGPLVMHGFAEHEAAASTKFLRRKLGLANTPGAVH
ncbi:MAG: sugar phosphate isomerase/epimerase, partial [Candidatus Omnitrophica bacterium]|nr:sugar phosphate isomerase/epimerase [Candidatus Omnitrophota bacterium]